VGTKADTGMGRYVCDGFGGGGEEEPDILAEMEMYSDWGEMITRAL